MAGRSSEASPSEYFFVPLARPLRRMVSNLQELLKVVDVEKQAHVGALLRLDGMKDSAEGYEKAAAAVRRIVSSCIVEAGASCTRGRVLCTRARV